MQRTVLLITLFLKLSFGNDEDLDYKRTAVVKYITENPKAKISDLSYMMEDFFLSHNLWEHDLQKREDFKLVMKKFDRKIKDAVVNRLHPFVIQYINAVKRKERLHNLFVAIRAGNNLRIPQLVSLIQPFIQSFEIKPEHSQNFDDFNQQVSRMNELVSPEETTIIFPYITLYFIYIKDITSRNNLLLQIGSKKDTHISSVEILVKSFCERYDLMEKDTLNSNNFNNLIKQKDFKIDGNNLNILRRYVNIYKEHLNRVGIRDKLIAFLEDSPDSKMSKLSAVMDPFLKEYFKFDSADNKEEFLRICRYMDYTFNEKHQNLIYPYYRDYLDYKNRLDARNKLLTELRKAEKNVEKLNYQIQKFSHAFHTIDEDVFDFESFRLYLSQYDDLISNDETAEIQKPLMNYNLAIFKNTIRDNLINFMDENKNTSFDKVSENIVPYMIQFIGSNNLIDNCIGKVISVSECLAQPNSIYLDMPILIPDHASKYIEYDERLSDLEALEKLIELRPKATFEMLKPYVERFSNSYITKKEEQIYFNDFIKIESILDGTNIERLKKVFSKVRLYSLFLNRSEIIKILNNFPDIENGDKDKSEFTVEILENLVDVFGIDSNDISSKEIFEMKINRFEKGEKFVISDEAFKMISQYVLSNEFKWRRRELMCVDEYTFCEVETPIGGSELGWFNFFRFFSGEPHKVNKKSLDDLNWFKRTFNTIYKYLTGFDYYVTKFDPFYALNTVKVVKETTARIPNEPLTTTEKAEVEESEAEE